MLKVGDTAPPIDAVGSDGKRFVLYEQPGLCTVIYFFPKAFTPGCTAETKRFGGNYTEIALAGAGLIGVSTDWDGSTQCEFAKSLRVPFPIVGDADRAICRAYDVLWPLIGVAHRITYVVALPRGTRPARLRAASWRPSSTTRLTSRPTGTTPPLRQRQVPGCPASTGARQDSA